MNAHFRPRLAAVAASLLLGPANWAAGCDTSAQAQVGSTEPKTTVLTRKQAVRRLARQRDCQLHPDSCAQTTGVAPADSSHKDGTHDVKGPDGSGVPRD